MKLKGRPLDDNGAIKFENTPTNLKQRISDLERRVKHWQTWYYSAEEYLCSCHLPDDIVCSWHKQNPGAPDAEVFTLADKVESLEQRLTDLQIVVERIAGVIPMHSLAALDLRDAVERSRQ